MSVTAAWDNEAKTVILMRYEHPWTLAEMDKAQADLQKMMESVSHPVDVLIDVRKTGMPPANSLGRFREISKVKVANQRYVFVIGGGMFIQTMVTSIQRVTRMAAKDNEVQFASTVEDARRILERLLTGHAAD